MTPSPARVQYGHRYDAAVDRDGPVTPSRLLRN